MVVCQPKFVLMAPEKWSDRIPRFQKIRKFHAGKQSLHIKERQFAKLGWPVKHSSDGCLHSFPLANPPGDGDPPEDLKGQ